VSPRDRHIAQTAARNAVRLAIGAGDLPRRPPACEACGVAGFRRPVTKAGGSGAWSIQYHHYLGYAPEHRLTVVPLCGSCHRSIHHGSLAEPRTGERCLPELLYSRHPDSTR
jgi:hypothetical protein